MKRVVTPEILDTDAASPAEVQQGLSDLRRVNRWFGGIRTTRRMLEKVIAGYGSSPGKAAFTLLDVGAGSGDVSLAAARQLNSRAAVRVTLLDRMPSHLPRNGVGKLAADALSLPFLDASFDLVTCSLLVHHLEGADIVRFVNEALRVARVAVLLNDLRRAPLHLALVCAAFPLFNRVSHHDGIASVRRAYTPDEITNILRSSHAASVDIENTYLFRFGAIAWKQAS